MTIIATGTGGLQGMLVSLLPLIGLMAIMYFMLMRPEKKRKQQYQEMLSSLAINDEIVTRGGIAGKIIRLDDDYMVIESGPDRTRIRLIRDSVFKKVSREESAVKMDS